MIQLLNMLCNGYYTWSIVLWKSMNDITCLDYESESTEDWVCSGMISKMPVVGREINSIWLLSVFVFPSVNMFSEGDRAEADENHSYFWLRQTKRRRRVWEPSSSEGPRTMFSGGSDHPHWMWFWDHPTECDSETTPTECDSETTPTECDSETTPTECDSETTPTECDAETTPHWMWFRDHPHWMWFWDHPPLIVIWDHPPLNVILRSPPTECDFKGPPLNVILRDHHWMWF